MIVLRDSPFCKSRKILHNLFLKFLLDISAIPGDICKTFGVGGGGEGERGGGYTKCIMGDVQMANKENIRICIGEKLCNSHGKSENV